MELEDFRNDFLETVRAHAAAEEDLTQASFVAIASQRLMDAEEFLPRLEVEELLEKYVNGERDFRIGS